MKLALLGDIHSNYLALEACLNFIEAGEYDGLVFLGDYVTDCPYPRRTLDMIRERTSGYQTWFIKGNREEYLLDHHDNPHGEWSYCSSTGSLLYTYEELALSDLEYFRSLPGCLEVSLPNCPDITIFHGSPWQLRDMVLPDSERADEILKAITTPYAVGAHCHIPYKYEKFGRTLLNCGSVGIPVNGQTDAQFLHLESSGAVWKDRMISVPYDIEGTLREFEESGLRRKGGMWAASVMKLLQTGRNYTIDCIVLAEQLAQEDGTEPGAFGIPELYWEAAALELGII